MRSADSSRHEHPTLACRPIPFQLGGRWQQQGTFYQLFLFPTQANRRSFAVCAVYTQKSTEEGLEQEFNSLDAQRESGEAFIRSQAGEGWTCLPDCYDDGGFTGGNTERPALQRLLSDIEAGKVDCVVVYKVDRLSRSLLDFAGMMQTFDNNKVNKCWQTRKGHQSGGKAFTKTSLHRLLTNVAYIGKVRYKEEVHDGEHPAIVDPGVFQRVQALLQRNGHIGGAPVRNQFGALLKGLLYCVPCGCAMTPVHTTKNNTKRYRYYTCVSAQKRGWDRCPLKSIPAGQIEQFVVEQIQCIGRDETLLQEVLAQARQQDEARVTELEKEQRGLEKDLVSWHSEIRKLSGQLCPGDDNSPVIARLADLHERIGLVEGRVQKVREQIRAFPQQLLNEEEARLALSVFDPVWDALTPREQARVISLLVERVDYDGAQGKVAVTFHPTGIKTLADELACQRQEKRA